MSLPLWIKVGVIAGVSAIGLAACGSSSKSSSTTPEASSGTTGSSAAAAGITVSAANVPGVGTVLVNGAGRTLYILTSEANGTVTCTDANKCTDVWPDSELPASVTSTTAGTGIQASLLSTTKTSDGDLYVTYKGFPLYTFTGDSAAAQAHGEGVKSFGGTWEAMAPDGTPVVSATTATTAAPSGGYGY